MCLAYIQSANSDYAGIVKYSKGQLFKIGKHTGIKQIPLSPSVLANINECDILRSRGKKAKHSRNLDSRINIQSQNLISIGIDVIVNKRADTIQKRNNVRNKLNVKRVKKEISNNSVPIALINARSIRSNRNIIKEFLDQTKPTILAITETWIKGDCDVNASDIVKDGYTLLRKDRSGPKNGGGVALLCPQQMKPRETEVKEYSTFEYLVVSVTSAKGEMRFCVLYRPPSGSVSKFLEEFTDLTESLMSSCIPFVMLGDFNLHVDSPGSPDVRGFMDILETMHLKQHVNFATHIKGHTLDLLITSAETNTLTTPPRIGDLISDHFAVLADINVVYKTDRSSKEIVCRNLKELDFDAFKKDIKESDLCKNPASDVESLVKQYNTCLAEILEKHAPLETKVKREKRQPWYTNEIHAMRQNRKRVQRRFKKNDTAENLQEVIRLRDDLDALIERTKTAYNSKMIDDVKHDQGKLFKRVNTLLKRKHDFNIPDNLSPNEFGDVLNDFFVSKIETIRSEFDPVISDQCYAFDKIVFKDELNAFRPLQPSEVRKLIMSSKNKTCALDPIPTTILKECVDELLAPVTTIINESLLTSTMPQSFKHALVVPRIKKANLPVEAKSFRPVSNLPFVSKLIEQSVISQLNIHFEENEIEEPLQSAYKAQHSCETALMRIVNDMLKAMDENKVILLALLDLSAAFDVVDHEILLNRLRLQGITGDVLTWLESYLSGRTQQVVIGGHKSKVKTLDCGMPQGSIFGPQGYKKFTEPLGTLLRLLLVLFHFYADDSQLWTSVSPSSAPMVQNALKQLESAIDRVSSWMEINRLKINRQKTEFLVLGTSRNREKAAVRDINVGNSTINRSSCAKNLGIMIDESLSLDQQVHEVVKTCRFLLRELWHIRKYLTVETAKTIVHATVISRLDFCNGLYVNMPEIYIKKLQNIMNEAARLVTLTPRKEHITPALIALHWLPVKQRIEYKILLTVHKAVNDTGPKYLKELLRPYRPSRSLRSVDQHLLIEPRYRLRSAGFRCFEVAAPRLWNLLPVDMRTITTLNTFKTSLKTRLFKQAYDI